MSRRTFALLLGEAVWLLTVISALGACAGARPPPGQAPVLGTPGTAEHVYKPLPVPSPIGTAVHRASHPPRAPFTAPRLVSLAEAGAVCNFDWRQSLAARVGRARVFATPAYAVTLAPSAADAANWRLTQQDRESATCSSARTFGVSTAPNTPAVRYERVEMTQAVRVGAAAPHPQRFAALYRVERQPDGRWLVAADGEGG
jgi:hypothetical protein